MNHAYRHTMFSFSIFHFCHQAINSLHCYCAHSILNTHQYKMKNEERLCADKPTSDGKLKSVFGGGILGPASLTGSMKQNYMN